MAVDAVEFPAKVYVPNWKGLLVQLRIYRSCVPAQDSIRDGDASLNISSE